jgi:hypothetical protein
MGTLINLVLFPKVYSIYYHFEHDYLINKIISSCTERYVLLFFINKKCLAFLSNNNRIVGLTFPET